MKHQFLFFTILFASLLVANAQEKEDSIKVPKAAILPSGFTANLNVVYTSGANWQQKLDVYLPPNNQPPTPAIINIHGGGWNHGTKESQSSGFSAYFKLNYAVINVEYRLMPEAKAPAAIEDVRCALAYVLKNAATLNIDPNKIVVMGGSAGGHLALLTGLMGNNHLFDSNCMGVENMHVAAIVDKWGIADLDTFTYVTKYKSAITWLDKNANNPAFIHALSPVTYITKNSPPVLIIHGDADPIVPYTQSVALHQHLQKAGVYTEFITVPGGKHGTFDKTQMAVVRETIIRFIQKVLAIK